VTDRAVAITTSNFDMANPLLDELVAAGFRIERSTYGRRLTESEVTDLLCESHAVGMVAGVEPLTEAVFVANPQLKVISRCGTGYDSVDQEAVQRQGIRLLNTPNAPATAVAELAVGLMMAVLRRIPEADRRVRSGTWKALMGSLLAKRIVGIVGLGRVGQRVAELVSAFGASIIYYDPFVAVPEHERAESIVDLASRVDLLSLHLPVSDATRGIIDREVLQALPEGAIVVNTARGGLLDEEALREGIESGKLAGAALDVFEEEPYEGPLAGCDNVVLTAHMGSYAKEARQLMENEALRNLIGALRDIE